MLTEFTDRRPALSAAVILLLFTAVPGAFLLLAELMPGLGGLVPRLVFVYVLVLQVVLWCKVERPILVMSPLILSLLGFVVSEIVYTISIATPSAGAGAHPLVVLLSSVLVTLFGMLGAASVGGLLAYGGIVILKKLWGLAARR